MENPLPAGPTQRNETVHQLNSIQSLLSKLIEVEDLCYILADNGYDESMLVGTTASYLRVAKTLIDMVLVQCTNKLDGDTERLQLEGINVLCSAGTKIVFSELSDVWPVCSYLVGNSSDLEKLVALLKTNSGAN